MMLLKISSKILHRSPNLKYKCIDLSSTRTLSCWCSTMHIDERRRPHKTPLIKPKCFLRTPNGFVHKCDKIDNIYCLPLVLGTNHQSLPDCHCHTATLWTNVIYHLTTSLPCGFTSKNWIYRYLPAETFYVSPIHSVTIYKVPSQELLTT